MMQYAPQTGRMHEVPLLVSAPWVNRYDVIMGLAPGRSVVEWAVRHGHSVFWPAPGR
jgi:polyhydroxyalkanoate synthase subunit PhaC